MTPRSRLPGNTVTSFTPIAPPSPALHAGISSNESVVGKCVRVAQRRDGSGLQRFRNRIGKRRQTQRSMNLVC